MNVSKFAETIARLRKEKGLTQKQLAEQFGVSDRSVSKWERGETMPDVALLPDIADFFAVSVDDLLRGDAEIEAPDAEESALRAKQTVSVLSAFRRHKTAWIVVDAIFALALIGWTVAGRFTANGWKDVAFSAVILLFFAAMFGNYALLAKKLREVSDADTQKKKERCAYALFVHCAVGAVCFLFCSGLFSSGHLSAALVLSGLLLSFFCFLRRDRPLVRRLVRAKIGALVPAAATVALCLFVPMFDFIIEFSEGKEGATLSVHAVYACGSVLGWKASVPFFLCLLTATAYTAAAVCKDLPSWSVLSAWFAVGLLSVLVCHLACNELGALYEGAGITAGIRDNHILPVIVYGNAAALAVSVSYHLLARRDARQRQR